MAPSEDKLSQPSEPEKDSEESFLDSAPDSVPMTDAPVDQALAEVSQPIDASELVEAAEAGPLSPRSGRSWSGRQRFMAGSMVTAMVAFGLAGLGAVIFHEHFFRWHYLRKICSEDPAQQQLAQRYLVREVLGPDPLNPRLSNDPTRQAALAFMRKQMHGAGDACFARSVLILNQLGVWGHRFDGTLWVRSLLSNLGTEDAVARRGLARQIASLLWNRWDGHDDARLAPALKQLLGDEDALVRYHALLAAACLSNPDERAGLILAAASDDDDDIAMRAWILLGLLRVDGFWAAEIQTPPPVAKAGDHRARAMRFAYEQLMSPEKQRASPRKSPEDADPAVKRLAQYEQMPTASVDLDVERETLPMLRIEAVRVSRTAEPEDLMAVYNLPVPPLRLLATATALQRFDSKQLNRLVQKLIDSFEDNQRMAGAILGGMLAELTEENLRRLQWRSDQYKTGQTDWWTVKSHYKLGLWMRGVPVYRKIKDSAGRPKQVPFEALSLMGFKNMPRSTTAVGLLHRGDLSGLDYFLDPLGKRPVSLVDLFSRFRYQKVVRRYLPALPPVWDWADEHTKVFQVEVMRCWYLLHRHGLEFDTAALQFKPVAGG